MLEHAGDCFHFRGPVSVTLDIYCMVDEVEPCRLSTIYERVIDKAGCVIKAPCILSQACLRIVGIRGDIFAGAFLANPVELGIAVEELIKIDALLLLRTGGLGVAVI